MAHDDPFFREKYNTEIENLKCEIEKQDTFRKEIRKRINEEEFYAKLLDKMIINGEKILLLSNYLLFDYTQVLAAYR